MLMKMGFIKFIEAMNTNKRLPLPTKAPVLGGETRERETVKWDQKPKHEN